MSMPIAPGGAHSPPSPLKNDRIQWGDNALSAPTTPAHRLPVVDKSKVDPQLLKAAEGMEAIFLDYMMKVMRDTVPKSEMDLENPATQIYRGMMDSETAKKAARAGGVGLADQIIAYLESARYTLPRGLDSPTAAPAAGTGGTHESRSTRDK